MNDDYKRRRCECGECPHYVADKLANPRHLPNLPRAYYGQGAIDAGDYARPHTSMFGPNGEDIYDDEKPIN